MACPRHPRSPAAEAWRGTKGPPFADQRREQRTSCPGKNSCRTHKSETIRGSRQHHMTLRRSDHGTGGARATISASVTSPGRVVSRQCACFYATGDRSTCSRVEFPPVHVLDTPWLASVTRTHGRSVKTEATWLFCVEKRTTNSTNVSKTSFDLSHARGEVQRWF